MSFLAPFFLLGAVAVAAPIIFHLIRRTSRDKIPFSSLMFLQPTPPRVTRSSRLEHILLLILRCLALCLLALGFGRPFLQRPVAADNNAGQGRRIAVLLDASASMRRGDLWRDAQARAERAVRDTTPADMVGVYLMDRTTRPLLSFEQWKAAPLGDRVNLAVQKIKDAEPGWGGTHLGHALLATAELLEDASGRTDHSPGTGPRRIVLVSDLQEGAHLDGLQGFEWPRGLELVLETVKARPTGNAGLQLILERDDVARPAAESEIKIRVSNTSGSKREQFRLGWLKPGEKVAAGPPLEVYVPLGQSRVLAAPKATFTNAELLQLSGDEEEFDNRVFVVTPKPELLHVIYMGADAEKDSTQLLYYMRRAFLETRRQTVDIMSRPASGGLSPAEMFGASLLVVGEAPTGAGIQAVRSFLDLGRPVLFVLRTAAAASGLAESLGMGTVTAEEVGGGGSYALLGQVDFEHPLFAPFADPRFSDFTKIHFWKHRRLDPAQFKGAKVLARFDQGEPALLQVPSGKGLVFILTSGWQPADSQLALSSKFVPLLHSLLELSGGVKAQLAQYLVGDPVTLPATNATAIFTVHKPDGKEAKVTGAGPFAETELPGVYTVEGGSASQRFAVNLDPSESRTGPLPLEDLERLHLPLKINSPEVLRQEEKRKLRLQAAELEQRQKLWRWLIVSALLVLLVETWLAGWVTRRSRSMPAEAVPA